MKNITVTGMNVLSIKFMICLVSKVGATGFEPATPATPWQCATGLRHAPNYSFIILIIFSSSFLKIEIDPDLLPSEDLSCPLLEDNIYRAPSIVYFLL